MQMRAKTKKSSSHEKGNKLPNYTESNINNSNNAAHGVIPYFFREFLFSNIFKQVSELL